jgi:hypothetical protein
MPGGAKISPPGLNTFDVTLARTELMEYREQTSAQNLKD